MKQFLLVSFATINSFIATAQWNDNSTVNLQLSTENSSDIVTTYNNADKFGGAWIAFYSFNNATNNYDMRVQRVDHSGYKKFGDAGLIISNRKSGTATFVFNTCSDHSGNLYVAFQYEKNSGHICLLQKVTQDASLPWGKKGIDLGKGLAPYPVILSSGEIAVAWSNDGVINFQKLDAATGAKAWTEPKEVVSSTGHSVSRPQLVAHSNGSFGMVYQDLFAPPIYTNLYMQRFNNDGNALWASAKKISKLTTSAARYYDVKHFNDTTYIGYYGNASGQNRFSAYLQKVGENAQLPFGNNGASFTNYTNPFDPSEQTTYIYFKTDGSLGSYVYAISNFTNSVQDQSGIYFQKFSMNTGAKMAGDFGKELFPISSNLLRLEGDAIEACYSNIAFTYTDISNKLYASAVDMNGNFAWNPSATLLCSTANEKSRFGFTYSNSFLLEESPGGIAVWQENRGGGDNPYIQDFNCAGKLGTLPLSITSFSAEIKQSSIYLYWQTANEINNKGFTIQRSANGVDFSDIAFVASKADFNSASLSYSFIDSKPLQKNYYRLKQTDKDGKISFSKVIDASMFSSGFAAKIFPNPVHNKLYTAIYINTPAKVNLLISDASGKPILKNEIIAHGNTIAETDIKNLAAGTYFVLITTNERSEKIRLKFIKQ